MLPTRWRDVLSFALAMLVAAASAAAYFLQRAEPGYGVVEAKGRYILLAVSEARPSDLQDSFVGLALGIVVLVGLAWWLGGGRAGAGLRSVAVPLASAASLPLLIQPFGTAGGPRALLGPFALVLASLLLADGVACLIESRRRRVLAVAIAGILAGVPIAYWSLLTSGILPVVPTYVRSAGWLSLVLAGLLVPLVPTLILTARPPKPGTALAAPDAPGPVWLIAAVSTPWVLGMTVGDPASQWRSWIAAPAWIAVLVASRMVTRRIARARLQRDLVVTVTEAERARLANELHDVALQELTLLVRRLDASGDAAAADLARSVSERLRELCGDLHLPILDELGAGPALEWLVGQVAGATGEDVRLERNDPARPPAGVELAVFRVAQEAISNAVKHGGPPIVVRYTTSPSAASLFVDDAGVGPDPERLRWHGRGPSEWDAGPMRIEPKPGHYGLASMQQRAEQIGALLSIRAWPGGGTRVGLEWKA